MNDRVRLYWTGYPAGRIFPEIVGRSNNFVTLGPPGKKLFGKEMKIVATEFYRKGNLLPFISWKVDSATAFGDHHVKFDLRNRRVIRASDGHSKNIATIEPGHKGSILRNFYGTVDSDTFKVTKKKKD